MGESNKPVYDSPALFPTIEVLINDCIDDTKLRSFFFMDVPRITELYSQIDSLQPIKRIEKTSTSKKQNVGGGIKSTIVGAEAGAEVSFDTNKGQQVETESGFFPCHSSYCKRVMKRLYEGNEVFILDIEERNYNPDIEQTFEKCCEILRNECHAPLPDYWLKTYREDIRKYATSIDGLKKEIESVYQNKRYILMKGDFEINNNVFTKSMDNRKIILEIPFNSEKADKDKLKSLTEHKIGNFTVFGMIEHWNAASSKLTIFPIAMY
ncbi:Uncharacterised protein [uncultured archaeon]|nr:Uncharacterised protein [uncultured archaeon]